MRVLLKKLDRWHLEILGIPFLTALCLPILYLCIRDGLGSFVFQVHDQLDEIILNYVFPARYSGCDVYEPMMCGLPAQGLKPFAPFFVPLYKIFNVYVAFLIQYIIVLFTAFYGMYFCVRKLTESSVSSLIAASLFSLLPVHSIYGNVVMGTPLLLYCLLEVSNKNRKNRLFAFTGLIFYACTTGLVLSGWAVLVLLGAWILLLSMSQKQLPRNECFAFLILLTTYFINNVDLITSVFGSDGFISHRTEFMLGKDGIPFLQSLTGLLFNGKYLYEAQSLHEWIYFPIGVATFFVLSSKRLEGLRQKFLLTIIATLSLALLYALTSTGFIFHLKQYLPGILSSFQITRWYYFFPGMMYLLLGISCAVILRGLEDSNIILSYIITSLVCIPTLLFLGKNPDGIFLQNVNQIINGTQVTKYITMKNFYAEDLMGEIERSIGEDITTYRVGSIGISPVVSLMHGFYTVDGYSNNYPLSYKRQFREVIAEELEQNDYIKAYFDAWGSRCYLFYHEWGNGYMLGNDFEGKITDLHFNFDELKKMNCRYLFSAGEIIDYENIGLGFVGEFTNADSFWDIWVYEIL